MKKLLLLALSIIVITCLILGIYSKNITGWFEELSIMEKNVTVEEKQNSVENTDEPTNASNNKGNKKEEESSLGKGKEDEKK